MTGETVTRLRQALRLTVITDATLAAPRPIRDVVAAALQAGASTIQLRNKAASARELTQQAHALLALTSAAGALLIINDRFDVALACAADGVHVGPHDIPVGALRAHAPRDFIIGASTDDPERARSLELAGADYLGCGAVFGTTTKDVGDESIGLERLDEVARAVSIPVVAIGGVTASGAARIAASTAACGVAVIGAVMAAADPAVAVRELLTATAPVT